MMIAPVIFCTVVHGIGLDARSQESRTCRRRSV
jgi:Na+/H+-dicarboxylate symporter